MNKKILQIIVIVMIVLLALPLLAMPGLSAELPNGAQLFEQNCAGCHVNGSNIIRRGKNLKQKAMTRNGYTSIETIVELVTNGKGNMSAYGDRLSSEEIQAISAYVFEQAQKDWKS
jgi:cytochrome c6